MNVSEVEWHIIYKDRRSRNLLGWAEIIMYFVVHKYIKSVYCRQTWHLLAQPALPLGEYLGPLRLPGHY